MVIILKVAAVSTLTDTDLFNIEYDRTSVSDMLNRTRFIQTSYSWAQPTLDPLPYTGAYFLSNALSTFGFVKANYSTGADHELRLNFLTIKIDKQTGCERSDFLMLTEIQSDGGLKVLNV
jgi:hypothetical protein